MRVFVAGATGIVGRELVPLLIEAGHEVVGLARSPESAAALEKAGAQAAQADALDRDAVIEAVKGAEPDAVIDQLTSIPSDLNLRKIAQAFEQTNRLRTEGTQNLLDGAEAAGTKVFVAQSISFAYEPGGLTVRTEDAPLWFGAPGGFGEIVRALEKHERIVLEAGGTALRYGHIYGPGSAYAPGGPTAEMVRKRRFPVVGDGGGIFSFVSARDAARAAVVAVERNVPGVYNIVDDEPAPVRQWLPAYAEMLGAPKPRRVPALIARPIAGELAVAWLTSQRGADNARARESLGWEPEDRSWRDGLAAG